MRGREVVSGGEKGGWGEVSVLNMSKGVEGGCLRGILKRK